MIDGDSEVIGGTLISGADIVSYDSLTSLGGNTFTLTLGIESTGDLSPIGFIGNLSDIPFDRAALFIGANAAGGEPLNFPSPAIVSAAEVELYDIFGFSIGVFDVSDSASLTAGTLDPTDGGWNGSLGVEFGPGSAGQISRYEFNVTYSLDGLPGDFNDDGIVDTADFTVWRDNLNAPDESSLNGNGSGQNGVDISDLVLWQSNFGQTSTNTVPEPASGSMMLLTFAAAGLALRRSKRSSW